VEEEGREREGTIQDNEVSLLAATAKSKERHERKANSPRSAFELVPMYCSPNRLGRVEKKNPEDEEGCDSKSIIPVGVEGGGAGNW